VRAFDGYARSHAERWKREDDLDDRASILTRVTTRRETASDTRRYVSRDIRLKGAVGRARATRTCN